MDNNMPAAKKENTGKRKIALTCIAAAVWIVAGIIVVLVTENIYGFSKHELFSEADAVTELDISSVAATNDVETTDNGYEIIGDDAYVIYVISEMSYIHGVRIEFAESFKTSGSVQVYYAGSDALFTEALSAAAAVSEGDTSVDIAIDSSDIVYIRVDVNMPEGTIYEINSISADFNAVNVLDVSGNPYFWEYIVLTLVAVAVYFLNRRFRFMQNESSRGAVVVLFGWAAMLICTYSFLLAGEYTISMSNLMYSYLPWSSSSTAVDGPLLSDAIDSFIPSIYDTYYGSGFSMWNNKIGFGVATGIQIIMYPFNWFYFLPLRYAIILKSMFEYSVAYFSMCYLLKRLKLSSVSQMIGGVSYAMSSAMVMWHFWAHTDVMMLAPLILGLGNKIVEERKLKDMFLMAIVEYLMLIAGMPTFAAYVIYLLGFYVLFMPIAKYRKDIKKIFHVYFLFAGAIVLGVICALPYLQTLLSTVGSNGYLDQRTAYGTATFAWKYLRTVILPYVREGLSSITTEATIYCGIAALVLFAFAGIRYKEKKQNFWIVSWVIIMLFVFTHYLDLIYTRMPEINTSLKTRIVAVLVLVTVVIAMISFDDILKNIEAYKKRWTRFIVYAVVIGVAVWALVQYNDRIWAKGTFVAALLVIIFIEFIIWNKKYIKQIACVGIALIVVVNMSIFAYEYMPLIDAEADIIPEATDSIEYLQENTDDERIYVIGDWALFPNTNVFYDLNSLSSHSLTNTNADIAAYLDAVDDEMRVTSTAYHGSKVDSYDLLKYAGVKYIVLAPAYTDTVIDSAELVYEGSDTLEIYELDEYNERFFLSTQVIYEDTYDDVLESMEGEFIQNAVFIVGEEEEWLETELSDLENIEILEDESDYIKLTVYTEGTRMLVLNEYNDGNWRVYIDGEETDLETVNYLFKGVRVESGEHTVEFVYDNTTTDKLLVVAGISMFIIITGLITTTVISIRRKKRYSSAKDDGKEVVIIGKDKEAAEQ